MGQQRDARKASANALREILGIEVPDDDGAFLSPEETDAILTSLETKDQLMLGGGAQADEEGVFISPEELESTNASPAMDEGIQEASSRAERRASPETQRYGESMQSDLLSRIAGELRSIKSEIGSLKTTYDEMNSKALSQSHKPGPLAEAESEGSRDTEASQEARTAEDAEEKAPVAAPAQSQGMPEDMLTDLKKLLGYMDRLLESLPEEKIDEFARSEYFDLYRKVFEFFDLA